MTPGSVVSFKDFTFHDGEQSDKLLIVINNGHKKPYLVLLTTSQKHPTRPPLPGCQHERQYYFIPDHVSSFDWDTWVLFHNPYILEAEKLIEARFEDRAHVVFELERDILRAIINCLKKTDDVSPAHISLL